MFLSHSMVVGMVHHNAINPYNIPEYCEFGVSKSSVAYSDFGKDFKTKEVIMLCDHMI